MELTSEQHLIRLAAEAFAVLTPDQIQEMSVSMDLLYPEVRKLFDDNEKRWETLKDEIVKRSEPRVLAPKPEGCELNVGDRVCNYLGDGRMGVSGVVMEIDGGDIAVDWGGAIGWQLEDYRKLFKHEDAHKFCRPLPPLEREDILSRCQVMGEIPGGQFIAYSLTTSQGGRYFLTLGPYQGATMWEVDHEVAKHYSGDE